MSEADIKAAIKEYVLSEFLPESEPDELQNDTPLVSGGILDSIGTVKLVSFLEEQFGIEFEAHEMGEDHLDSIDLIAGLIEEKRAS